MRQHPPDIVPVLLSGGGGSRLWPLSRRNLPKQFLSLAGEETLIQQAALRVRAPALFSDPVVIANFGHRFIVAEQFRSLELNASIILEPFGRSTAAAAAVAALHAVRTNAEALLLLMPVDQIVRDVAAFHQAVRAAADAAQAGHIALFAIKPSSPATGYGYLTLEPPEPGLPGIHRVSSFTEKPGDDMARSCLANPACHWNSGMLLTKAQTLVEALESHAPRVLAAMRAALDGATQERDFLRLASAPMEGCPTISLDHAVMQHTGRAVAVPLVAGWSDVGSWSALWEFGETDGNGNVLAGSAVAENATGCYLRSDGPLVAAVGVDDLIVSATPDAVLVTRQGADQSVGQLVRRLDAEGHVEAAEGRHVHRSWGSYRVLHTGERFQIKQLTVDPGQRLSLQSHDHRAELWMVVEGAALVTLDGSERVLHENDTVLVPVGSVHRLENPGQVPLCLIEVQSGSYLGEDDIVRFDDADSGQPGPSAAPRSEPAQGDHGPSAPELRREIASLENRERPAGL